MLSVDLFLAARPTAQPGVEPVTLQDMERAIAEYAAGVEGFEKRPRPGQAAAGLRIGWTNHPRTATFGEQ